MATAHPSSGKSSKSSSRAKGGSAHSQIGSPISNEAYNVITALQAKLEGLEAYRKYAQDADEGLWEELTKADVQCVSRLIDELERLVQDGELRSEGLQEHA